MYAFIAKTVKCYTGAYCSVSCPSSFFCHKPKALTTSRTHTRILASSNIIADSEANLRVEVVIISFYENS